MSRQRYYRPRKGQPWPIRANETFKTVCDGCGLVHRITVEAPMSPLGIIITQDHRAAGQIRRQAAARVAAAAKAKAGPELPFPPPDPPAPAAPHLITPDLL